MTQIPLEFNKEKTRLTVVATIRCAERVPFPVRFIIDTGSEDTIIDENITATVRIFTKNLDFDKFSLLAGTKIGFYKLGKAEITFIDADGKGKTLPFDGLGVTANARPGRSSVYIPISLLGMDFFLETRSKLIIDSAEGSAYIEM